MLTEQEITEKKARIHELENQKNAIQAEIKCLTDDLNTDICEKARAKFPHIKEGDKVIIHWTGWRHRPQSETYYFDRVVKSRWTTNGLVCPDYVNFVFKKTKKDGSPSLREEFFSVGQIDKIEKVQ